MTLSDTENPVLLEMSVCADLSTTYGLSVVQGSGNRASVDIQDLSDLTEALTFVS